MMQADLQTERQPKPEIQDLQTVQARQGTQRTLAGQITQKAQTRHTTQEALTGQITQDALAGQTAQEALAGQTAQEAQTGQTAQDALAGQTAQDTLAGQTAPLATAVTAAAVVSPGQRDFLEAQLLHKRQVRTTRVMLLVLLLALWELAACFSWIDSFIFSSPSQIFRYFCSMAKDGSLFLHTGVTLLETILSFFLVITISLGTALLLWACRALSEVLEPYLVMLNSLPKSAMAPLLIVWLGNDTRTIVVAAVSVALFGSILTLHTGFSQTDPDKIKLIYSLGGTKWDVLTKVLLPSSIPLIVSSMKVNIGLCLVGVIIGEFLASRAGLGYLITYGSQTFQMTLVVTSIVVLCIISALLYQMISLVEKRVR